MPIFLYKKTIFLFRNKNNCLYCQMIIYKNRENNMRKLIPILLFVCLSVSTFARPQYSILGSYGTKCTSCHVNPGMGGQRSFMGFLSRSSTSLINPSSIGLQGLYDLVGSSNEFLGGKLVFGLDFRYQNARWAQSQKLEEYRDGDNVVKPELERKGMFMQMMPYLQVKATDWLSFEGMYNASYDAYPNMVYPGQQPYSASATIDFGGHIPAVRIGYFNPIISVDYDDHTLLVRQAVGPGRANPLIPVDNSDLGIQFNYNGISWLNANLGFFDSKNMSELMINNSEPIVNDNTLSTAMNLSVHPGAMFSLMGYDIHTFFGVSHFFNAGLKSDDGVYFGNGYYTITSGFLNIGLAEKLALMTEYIYSEKQSLRTVDNYLVELTYQLMEPLNVFVRYEGASTDYVAQDIKYEANQYVFGAHIFPLPFIDLLPEYRIYDRGDVKGTSAQWALQVHIFY